MDDNSIASPQEDRQSATPEKASWVASEPRRIVLWVFTALTFGVTLFPNYGLTQGLSIFGTNLSSVKSVSRKFRVDIAPADYSYFIWTLVFIWQIVWLVYTGTLIFRPSKRGYLYYSPPFMSNWTYGFFIISSILDFIWNIFWGLELIPCCLVTNILQTTSLGISLGVSFLSLRRYGQELIDQNKKKDVLFTIFFVQYGIGLYLCQLSCSLLVNIASVLTYYCKVSLPTAGATSLSILLVAMTIWFSLENFKFEKCCRYFFVPYIVYINFLAGSFANNMKSGAPNSIFTAFLLTLTIVYLAIKAILVKLRSKKESLFNWNSFLNAQLHDFANEQTPLFADDNP